MEKTNLFLIFIFLVISFSANAQNPPYVVNTLDDVDDGQCNSLHCSLREAINAVNANSGSNTITFNIPSAPNGGTITLTNTLPNLIDNNTTIDVTASSANYDPFDIGIDGINVGFQCFYLLGSGIKIYGLAIVNFGTSISIADGSDNNQIGDYLRPNFLVGDLATLPCNTCTGITIRGDNNTVIGNSIYNMYSGSGGIQMWGTSSGNTTIVKQFIGGLSLNNCAPTITKLKTADVFTILDYGAEGKGTEADLLKQKKKISQLYILQKPMLIFLLLLLKSQGLAVMNY